MGCCGGGNHNNYSKKNHIKPDMKSDKKSHENGGFSGLIPILILVILGLAAVYFLK
ncbi:hypothetical protein QBE52_04475 [Clostridiaceae bacterium 35-E11]